MTEDVEIKNRLAQEIKGWKTASNQQQLVTATNYNNFQTNEKNYNFIIHKKHT